ncbi:hypothetical protein HZH66_002517 [Vespula vulgaris]|uniref:Uncharacterized protein n=1 Tax=Vespula vulgaris TaxID=7454 RepID=A0A834KJV3_VESVU|nr:hypothetical protein HZH66_002517 [Vespula vulgaris]
MHSYADASGDFLKTESDMEDALTKEKTNESSWRSALLLDSSTTLWLRYPEAGPRQLANFQAAGKGEDNWRKRFFTMDRIIYDRDLENANKKLIVLFGQAVFRSTMMSKF